MIETIVVPACANLAPISLPGPNYPPGLPPISGGGGTPVGPVAIIDSIGLRLNYTVKIGTTAIDPTTGSITFNTVPQGNATHLYISQTDTSSSDTSVIWNSLAAGTQITIQMKTNADQIARYTVVSKVDNGTWFDITVTPIGSVGLPFANNDFVIIYLV